MIMCELHHYVHVYVHVYGIVFSYRIVLSNIISYRTVEKLISLHALPVGIGQWVESFEAITRQRLVSRELAAALFPFYIDATKLATKLTS